MAGTAMKALTLLAVLLCLEGAWAIKCHSCNNLNGNTCQNKTECPASDKVCVSQTIHAKAPGQKQTVTFKGCAPNCDGIPTKSRSILLEGQVSLYCCNTDLCNGARSGASATGLMLVAGVLTTLLGTWL